MKFVRLFQIFAIFSLALISFADAGKLKNKRIAIIRHGEKPDDDNLKYLSPEGKARAKCLINTILEYNIIPQKIYAQQANEIRRSTRPIDTVTPLAETLGLEIDTTFREGHIKQLAKDIKGLNDVEDILICWSRDKIPKLAEKLGVKIEKDLEWNKKIFNDIWIIEDGKLEIKKQNTEECIKNLLENENEN